MTSKALSTTETKKQVVVIIVNILILNTSVNSLSAATTAHNPRDATAAIEQCHWQ